MSELTENAFKATLELNAEYRQAMFLREIQENKGFYVLIDNDGPVLLEDTETDENGKIFNILPVWSHEVLANDYASKNQVEAKAQFITLEAWNQSWVPAFEQQDVLVGFMPVGDKDFSVDDPKAF